jgi:glutamate decarboxylase
MSLAQLPEEVGKKEMIGGKEVTEKQNLSLGHAQRYITEQLPKFQLPEKSLSAAACYQLICDELSLQCNPALNMGTYLTSWMEPEADRLIRETLGINMIDHDAYPSIVELEKRCVCILSRMWNVPRDQQPIGTSCAGSAEAFILGALAMKFQWKKKQQAKGKAVDKPNIVMSANAHIAMKKFALYFDVELRLVPATESSRFVLNPQEVLKYVDENTIGIAAVLGSTYTGHFDDIQALSQALDRLQSEKGLNIPIHVDAAAGGFVAPFLFPELVWDFRLPRVKSINVSGHKYGLVYPGIGWVVWRDAKELPQDLIVNIRYLEEETPTFNLNFSRSASQVIAQYYNFLRLGRSGYTNVLKNCMENAAYLSKCLQDSGMFQILSVAHQQGHPSLPVVTFSLQQEKLRGGRGVSLDEHTLSKELRRYGWIVPAYSLHGGESAVILRATIRESHSKQLLDLLMKDLLQVIAELRGERREPKKERLEALKGKEAREMPLLGKEQYPPF